MKKRTRILFFIPLLLFISFGVWNYYYGWRPPEFSPELFHTVSVDTITIKHPGSYEMYFNLILNGRIIFMEIVDNQLQLYLQGVIPIRINCCFIPQAYQYSIGDTVYLKGFAYFYFNTSLKPNSNFLDGYFLATEGHKHTSYSLYLSIGGLAIVLIVLFSIFKMKKDFSFIRREGDSDA
ncbi:MAG: hypothetical protein ACTSO9_17130 [Candidatus Helarchaeota archaeon]